MKGFLSQIKKLSKNVLPPAATLRFPALGLRAAPAGPHIGSEIEKSTGELRSGGDVPSALRGLLWGILLILPFMLAANASHGQETSSIVGTVTDQSGAVVTGATVTLTQTATRFTRVVQTGDDGQYVASAIPPGTYNVTAKKSGFKLAEQKAVQLSVASTQTVDIRLSVGATAQTVVVTASAPLLQRQSAAVSALVDSRQMLALPLETRDFTNLVVLTPGAHGGNASNLSEGGSGYAMQGGNNYSVNGTVAAGSSYMIDGIYDRMLWLNTLVIEPIVDSIQEYRVMTSNYSAEYGNAAGAVTDVETKSGSNAFHGDLWEFLRNTDLNANDFFNNRNNIPRPPYHRNQFGFTIGGPILRNHTFFFGDYEGTRRDAPATSTTTIPTVAQDQMVETGNFANFGTTIYDPLSVTTVGGVKKRNPFPGNQIPVARLDPVAVATIALLPAPTNSGIVDNYVYNAPSTGVINQFDIRIDQNLHHSDRLFVHYDFTKGDFVTPGVIPSPAHTTIPIGPYLSTGKKGTTEPLFNQLVTVGYTKILRPSMVLQSHAALVRWHAQITPLGMAYDTATALGMPGINFNQESGGMPSFNVTGFEEIGDNSTYPEDSAQTTFQEDSQLIWTHGKHTVRTGVVAMQNIFNGFSGFYDRGNFNFNGEFTSPLNSSSSSTALADFALGAMDTGSRAYLDGTFSMRTWEFSTYITDSWRVTNRLTVTPGVRWDLTAPPYEGHNHWANLDIQDGLLLLAGQDGNGRRLVNFDFRNVGPRLGLAYSLGSDNKTVIRTGFGLSYVFEDIGGNELYKNLPYYSNQVITTSRNTAPTEYLRQGLPVPVAPIGETAAQLSTGSPKAWDRNLEPDLIASWSLGVQRQLTNSIMLDVSYLGTMGDRLILEDNINQAVPGPGAVAPREPYHTINPNLVDVDYYSGKGQSKYESLQIHLEKRYSNDLTFGASYTYSEYLSDSGDPNGGGNSNYQNDYCIACNWGPESDDYKHVLVVNQVYNLPFGRNEPYLQGGIASKVLGGWQFNGIWSVRSGARFTPFLSANVSNQSDGGKQRPNAIGSGMLPQSQRTLEHWFNTAAFVAPPQYTYGNAGTGMLTGPGSFDAALGLFRSFQITHGSALTFRSEWFNAFNRPNFDPPDATIGTPEAGVISSGGGGRVIQLAMKYVF